MSISFKFEELDPILSIELPVLTRNTDSAYKILGGEDLVKSSLRSDAHILSAKFSNSNTLKNFIYADKEICNGAVIKIRRKKRHLIDVNKDHDDNFSVEVLGRSIKSYRFQQPADYMVIFKYKL
jgi:hypothetical protein